MDELIRYLLEQASTPFVIGVVLVATSVVAVLQCSYSRRIGTLRRDIKLRDERLAELQNKLLMSNVNELQAKVSNLKPQPRRRVTAQQKTFLAEHARVPEGRQFTIEIIHDMSGSDCSAYANDFRSVFHEIGGWSISRSAVLGPGWVARCGLGVHVQDREILSRPETVVLNALAAAGIDYDLVRIPQLDADVGLLVTPAPVNRPQPADLEGNGFEVFFADPIEEMTRTKTQMSGSGTKRHPRPSPPAPIKPAF